MMTTTIQKKAEVSQFSLSTAYSLEKSDFSNKILFCYRNRKHLAGTHSDPHLTSQSLVAKTFMLELQFMP